MKRFSIFLLGLLVSYMGTAQTARTLITEACKKDSVEQSISYIEKTLVTMQDLSEQRGAYIYLAGIQEKLGRYNDAQKNYAKAASIAAKDAEGMQKKSSEQVVIDAVRCALCAGDGDTAQSYLNSAVRNSKDEKILAYVKLYEQWALLIKARELKDTEEVVAILKTYAELNSMKSVKPQILFTLWHLTGNSAYSASLKKDFSGTPEEAIVSGKVQLQPSPFWYFVPRSGNATPDDENPVIVKKDAEKPKEESEDTVKSEAKNGRTILYQLGLFRENSNAQALVDKLKKKGFEARIKPEVRPSGTTYYLVVVDDNEKSTVGDELRTAGFECYPVFE